MSWEIRLFRWLIAVLLIGGSGYAVARHLQDGNTAGHYGSVEVVRPEGTPKAMVVLLPDSGHAQDGQRLAEMLSNDGALVAVIDTASYRERVRSHRAACSSLADDAERLGKKLLRAEHVDAFLPPVLVGQGDGAVLARQALASAAPDVLGARLSPMAAPAMSAWPAHAMCPMRIRASSMIWSTTPTRCRLPPPPLAISRQRRRKGWAICRWWNCMRPATTAWW